MKRTRLFWIFVVGCMLGLGAHAETPRESSIRVSGEAVVNVRPDKIIVTMGVETWNENLAIAKKQNDDILKRALASIQQGGVPAAAIETDTLQISPTWVEERDREDNFRRRTIRGYSVANRFSVTLADAAKVEDIVTRALTAGVNNIHDISFLNTRFKEYREQARELAMKAAREKAAKMAAALGQSIGEATQISEGGSHWGYGQSSRMRSMSQNAMQNISDNAGGESDPESIALGKIAIRANVDVVFVLQAK